MKQRVERPRDSRRGGWRDERDLRGARYPKGWTPIHELVVHQAEVNAFITASEHPEWWDEE